MKKILFLCTVLLLCTGCNETLTCKEKGTNNSYYIEVTSDNKIDKITLHYEVEEADTDTAKKTEENLKEQFANAENFKNPKVSRNGKLVKMDVEVSYVYFFKDNKKSIEDVKKYFEKQLGMRCYD